MVELAFLGWLFYCLGLVFFLRGCFALGEEALSSSFLTVIRSELR